MRLGYLGFAALGAFIFASAASADPARVKGVIALVPGTINHLAPGSIQVDIPAGELELSPYFSGTILKTLKDLGYAVMVVRDLAALGSAEVNGTQAAAELRDWYLSRFPARDVPITLLAHSAGGFYALRASEEARDLPIKQLALVQVPITGADLANLAVSSPDVASHFQFLFEKSQGVIDLRGLPEMTTERSRAFLSRLKLDPRLKITSFGCTQRPSLNPLAIMDAHYLWPIFYATSALIEGPADGVVGLHTVYGDQLNLPTADGKSLRIAANHDVTCNLDHPQQVLDYRLFRFLGQHHVGYIAEEQARFYTAIVRALEASSK